MFADINEAAYFQYRPIAGIEDATSLCLVDFHANTTGVRHGDGVPFFDDHSESRQLASGALDSPEKHTVKARRMLRRKGNGNIIPQKFESFFPGSIAENRRTGQRQSRKSPRKRGMLFPFEWSDCFLTVSFVKSFQFSQLLSKNSDIFSTFYRIR